MTRQTAFILVHGSWQGAWAWGPVLPYLWSAGHAALAIDLPGHGLRADLPAGYLDRPRDSEAFSTAPSALAAIPDDAYAAAVREAAAQARTSGARRIVAVGHSMGGMPVTLAAAGAPEAFDDLILIGALTCVPGTPSMAYMATPQHRADTALPGLLVGDPRKIGVLRIDPLSDDPAYLARAQAALGADVPDRLWQAGRNLMTPDAPNAIYRAEPVFAPGYAGLRRHYIRCADDRTIPAATSAAMIADMNLAWPDNPCTEIVLPGSHMPMWARPAALAGALLGVL